MAGERADRDHPGAELLEHRQQVVGEGDHAGPAVGDRRVDPDALAQQDVEPVLHRAAGHRLLPPLAVGELPAPAAERDPPVGGLLPVLVAPVVVDRARDRPGRDRRGGEHLQPRGARAARELGEHPLDPAVDADDDRAAAHGARRRLDPVAGDRGRRRVRRTAARPPPAPARASSRQRSSGWTDPSVGTNTPRPARPVRGARREAVALERRELRRDLALLLRRAGDPQRADAARERAELGEQPVELGERLRVDPGGALAPPGGDRVVVEARARRRAGTRRCGPPRRRRPGRRRARRRSRRPRAPRRSRPARSRPARRRRRRRLTSPASGGGFPHADGSPQTGVAEAVTRGILRGDADRAATLRLGVPARRRRRGGRAASRSARTSRPGRSSPPTAAGSSRCRSTAWRTRPGSAPTRAASSRSTASARAAACAAAPAASRSPPTAPSAAVVEGCADPRRPGGWITAEVRARLRAPARARLGALDRGLGRRRDARRRALRRRARRAVRGRVEVPRRHRRVEGRARRARRAAARGRRRARARRAVDDAAPAHARRARPRAAGLPGAAAGGAQRAAGVRAAAAARRRRAPRCAAGAASRARSRAAGSATCPRRAA